MFEEPIHFIVVIVVFSMFASIIVALWILRSFYIKVAPNKVAVISGKSRELVDGTIVGYRLVTGGATLVIPFFEKVEYLDFNITTFPLLIKNAYTIEDTAVSIKAVANIKIKSDESSIRSAVERFLGMSEAKVHQVVSQSLEGHLRTVLRIFTVKEINKDSQILAQELLTKASNDLDKMGIELNAFTIQEVLGEESL